MEATLSPAALLAREPEHPVWVLPSEGQVMALAARGEEGIGYLSRLLEQRRQRIAMEQADPFRHGIRLSSWERAEAQIQDRARCNELLVLGGNRAAKSEWAALKVVQALFERPNAEAWCFQTTEKNSQLMQQPRVWHYLPPEWKAARRGQITCISYKKATGFTNNRFVGPNGSLCDFRNYAQDINTIEGGEIDIAWCDELVPLNWIDTLRFRLVTRNGLLIVTFTPIDGYTPTVKAYLEGARTVEDCEAELLAHETDPARRRVPLVQQCYDPPTARVVYFHTQANPFNPWDRMKAQLAKRPRADILTRAYGVPTKAVAGRFPRFGDTHVVDQSRFEAVRTGTWYHVVDPCNGRNFAMIWALVTADRRVLIAREWPQEHDYIPGVGNPGAWAVPDGVKHDGAPGDAQRPFGFGLERYRDEIARVEAELGAEWAGRKRRPSGDGWEPIDVAERLMDSRFGNAPTLARGEATTLIEEFAQLDPPLDFEPAAGSALDEGIALINDRLDFDAGEEVGALNQPSLYVHERCRAVRFALATWTGQDGKHGACKDFVDLVRYLLLADPVHVEPGDLRGLAGGPGGWEAGTFSNR